MAVFSVVNDDPPSDAVAVAGATRARSSTRRPTSAHTRAPKSPEGPPIFEQAFKNIDDVLHKDAGCTSELDYTEQSSWLLFLKYLCLLYTSPSPRDRTRSRMPS